MLLDGLCRGVGRDGMEWHCNAVDMRGRHFGGSITTHKESHLFFLAGFSLPGRERETHTQTERDREEQKFTNKACLEYTRELLPMHLVSPLT